MLFSNRGEKDSMCLFEEIEIACINISGTYKQCSEGQLSAYLRICSDYISALLDRTSF